MVPVEAKDEPNKRSLADVLDWVLLLDTLGQYIHVVGIAIYPLLIVRNAPSDSAAELNIASVRRHNEQRPDQIGSWMAVVRHEFVDYING